MMALKSEHPLEPEALKDWIGTFSDEELSRHGWSKSRLQECVELYDYIYKTYEPEPLVAEEEPLSPAGWPAEAPAQAGAPISLIFFHFTDSDTIEIIFLATSPLARQRAAMVELFGALMERLGKPKIWLECREDNVPARRLYAKLGMREVGRRARYYHDGTTAILFDF